MIGPMGEFAQSQETGNTSETQSVDATKQSKAARIGRKAAILTFGHPFGATEMMANSYAWALSLHGYEVSVGVLGQDSFEQTVRGLGDPALDLVFNLGSVTLDVQVGGRFLWEVLPPEVLYISVVVDALPYDLRMGGFARFVADYAQIPNGHLVCYEGNVAAILQELTGKRTFYMPTGANTMPRIRRPKKHPYRLMFWGSLAAELLKDEQTGDLPGALAANNVWGFEPPRLQRVAEQCMHTDEGYALGVLAQACDIPVPEMLKRGWIDELCKIDGAIKRYRRHLLLTTLKDLPIDIYGKNWDGYVEGWDNVRVITPKPDHNLTFGTICQDYGGVVNVDPNWGWGTNERAITALQMGCKLITSNNRRVQGARGCFQYGFEADSIRDAADALWESDVHGNFTAEATWEYLLSNLLMELSAEAHNSQ